MADRESLENLIEGLAGAVVEAQRRIESHQIENFLSYFNENNRPKGIDIRLPPMQPDKDPTDDVLYHVPFLPLFASSLLSIKEVEISFDTDIAGLAEPSGEDDQIKATSASDDTGVTGKSAKRSVNLDIRGGMFGRRAGRAHVVLKVQGGELSEGMARVIDRLLQSQGEL